MTFSPPQEPDVTRIFPPSWRSNTIVVFWLVASRSKTFGVESGALALFATANWVHIPFEEAKMRRQFGAAYDDYVARVRRWI